MVCSSSNFFVLFKVRLATLHPYFRKHIGWEVTAETITMRKFKRKRSSDYPTHAFFAPKNTLPGLSPDVLL